MSLDRSGVHQTQACSARLPNHKPGLSNQDNWGEAGKEGRTFISQWADKEGVVRTLFFPYKAAHCMKNVL